VAHNGSYMQVRCAQSGRLQGWMFVSQDSRKYDRLRVVASNPPRPASWRIPERGDRTPPHITDARFYTIDLPFREWIHRGGRVERVLANPGYSMEQLESTHQFWQADEEDE
jgi:hypothetical protein